MHEKLHERWRNRPSEVCLQGLVSNHPQRHRSKAFVVSVVMAAKNAGVIEKSLEHGVYLLKEVSTMTT